MSGVTFHFYLRLLTKRHEIDASLSLFVTPFKNEWYPPVIFPIRNKTNKPYDLN